MNAKFKLIRHNTTGHRVWEDEHDGVFLADRTGDRPGHIGTPDDVASGPLLVDSTVKRFTLDLGKSTGRWPIRVLVLNRMSNQDPVSEELVNWEVAAFLSDRLHIPMEMKLGNRVFALVEVNVAARESVLI